MVVDTVVLIRVICKHCQARVKVPETARGRACRCPKCKRSTRVSETAPTARQQRKVQKASYDGQFIRFHCVQCHTRNKVLDSTAGQWVACGNCATVNRVPELKEINGWTTIKPATLKKQPAEKKPSRLVEQITRSDSAETRILPATTKGGSVHGLLHFSDDDSIFGDETKAIGLDDPIANSTASRLFGNDSLAADPIAESHIFPSTEQTIEDSLDLGIDEEPNTDDTIVSNRHLKKPRKKRLALSSNTIIAIASGALLAMTLLLVIFLILD